MTSKKSKKETLQGKAISQDEMNRILNSPYFIEKDERAMEILKEFQLG